MDNVLITNPMLGICGMQVCAHKDATDEEILLKCNTDNRTGNGWVTVVRKKEDSFFVNDSGEPNDLPGQCRDYEDRMHLIVLC